MGAVAPARTASPSTTIQYTVQWKWTANMLELWPKRTYSKKVLPKRRYGGIEGCPAVDE